MTSATDALRLDDRSAWPDWVPAPLITRAVQQMSRDGVVTLDQLAACSIATIRHTPNLGEKTITAMRALLQAHGKDFDSGPRFVTEASLSDVSRQLSQIITVLYTIAGRLEVLENAVARDYSR